MQRTSFWQRIILIILGIFLCVSLLEIGLRIGGFIFFSLQEHRNRVSLKKNGEYRIMCLGESTTALGGENSYPSQLEVLLNERHTGIKFSVINKGVCGIKTSEIANELESNIDKYRPNMILTMIGINDRDAAHLPYEDADAVASRNKQFLNNFKTYNLFKLICLHITAKLKECENRRIKNNGLNKNRATGVIFQKPLEPSSESDTAYFELGSD